MSTMIMESVFDCLIMLFCALRYNVFSGGRLGKKKIVVLALIYSFYLFAITIDTYYAKGAFDDITLVSSVLSLITASAIFIALICVLCKGRVEVGLAVKSYIKTTIIWLTTLIVICIADALIRGVELEVYADEIVKQPGYVIAMIVAAGISLLDNWRLKQSVEMQR